MAKASAPKTVTLVAPDGSGDVQVSDAVSLSSLRYGSGYSFKDKGMTEEKALEVLAGGVEDAVAANASAPTSTAVVTPATPSK